MTDATPYIVPKEPGRWRAIALAALVHIALLVFFWIGIRWQNETPATIEAEIWSPQVREAAPPPPPPQPEPQPVVKEPQPAPPPVAKPEPPAALPGKNPDIALEQEKKRKAREEQKRQERLEEERLAKQKQKAEEEKLARQKQKAEEEKLARQKQKAEEEKFAKRKEEEKQRLAKEEGARKAAAEKKRKQEEAEDQALAKVRDDEMRRITGGVAGTGGSGDAAKSQGGGRADAGYAQRVGAKIKSNINYNGADEMPGNPAVEYVVDLLPDGSVAGMRKTKSSGVPGFDEAVRRAIEKSQPFPKDKSGAVPSSFIGIHRPKDQ
jgi:colicin import membrane protein